MGVAEPIRTPSVVARMKSVWLDTPTQPAMPFAIAQSAAPEEASVSMNVQYTPPCTTPYG
jgi:hypothetical protein